MAKRLRYAGVIVASVLLAACGGGPAPSGDKVPATSDCIILENGNKLCGADAQTYCEGFVKDGDNAQNIEACDVVGVVRHTQAQLDAIAKKQQDARDAAVLHAGDQYQIAIADDRHIDYVEADGNAVTVTTDFQHIPREWARQACYAIKRVNPSVTATIEGDFPVSIDADEDKVPCS